MLFATFFFKSYVWDKCVFRNMALKMLSTNQIAGFSNLERKQWNSVIFYILMQSDESLCLFKNFCLNLVKNGCGHHSISPFLCWGTFVALLSVPNFVQLSVPDFQKGGSGKNNWFVVCYGGSVPRLTPWTTLIRGL